jgi:ribosomal-protein-alanine N-acetyltransferase
VPTDGSPVSTIRTPRLELVSMSPAFMEALLAGETNPDDSEVDATVPAALADGLEDFIRYRLAQLAADPSILEFLGRAMVLTQPDGTRRVVGIIGFHGPPDAQRRLEVGYRVDAEHRRQGYARESVKALFDWAAATHGIQRFIASVSPTNVASLALVRGLGFAQTGEQMDEIDGPELVFEGGWPPRD